jgi:hypothetical protein
VAFIGAVIAAIFVFALLTYLAADNPFYRIAAHLFIGISSGYAVMLVWYNVIWPSLVRIVQLREIASGPTATLSVLLAVVAGGVGTAGGLLLMFKTAHVLPRLGGLVVAFILGVGAAVAVGGAITGTLIPQTAATFPAFVSQPGIPYWETLVEGFFTVIGTLVTLGFFWYGGVAEPGNPVERTPLIRPVAAVGQLFIAVTFGVMYAGALAASVAIFANNFVTLKKMFGL